MVVGTLLWLALAFGVLVAASYVGTTLALRSYFDGGGRSSRGPDRRSGGRRRRERERER